MRTVWRVAGCGEPLRNLGFESVDERLQRLHDFLDVELEKFNIDKRVNVNVKKQMEKAQKEYYLNEKIKAIHQELGTKRR